MKRDRWPEIEALFAEALDQPEGEREPFVHSRAGSAEVAREVLSLLAAHARSGVFDPVTARQDALEEADATEVARLREALADRYTVEHELGAGGMATVYLARDEKHQRRVALKVLRPEIAAALGQDRFLREITTTANLRHPHILPLFDSGRTGGQAAGRSDQFVYYVMPHVEGETLRQKLNRETQLGIAEALRITSEVADALEYAHAHGVVHRDIKPENILLESGHAVVADFGIARALDAAGGERLTETGIAVGTPAYMSPEQAAGERNLDGRSDLYALGCMLYEMLAGRPPFTGPSAESLVRQHLVGTPPPVTQLRPAVPAAVAATIDRLLAKTPADRLATGAELVAELARRAAEPAASTPAARRRRWWVPTLSGLMLVIVAVVAVRFGPWFYRPHAIESMAVIPFENQTGDSAEDYFVDGVHEALIAELSRVSELRVISRTSVLGFRGTTQPVPEIARQLNVDAVIEGSVLRAGDSVRIQASLIDAATDRTMRTVTYVRSLRNVLELLRDVASGIAGELAAATTPPPESLPPRPLVDPAAYEAYLKARYLIHDWPPEKWRGAVPLYQRAIALDSSFALARAGLSQAFFLLGYFGREPEADVWPKARSSAQQAIELDAGAGEAYTTLGYLRLYADWDWDGAETALLQALRLDPNDAFARHGLADLLTIEGRPEEGLRQTELGRQADPLSSLVNATVVGHLYLARHFEEALAELQRVHDRFPESSPPGEPIRAASLWLLQRDEEAWGAFRERWSRSDDQGLLQAADRGYADGGPRAGMRAAADYAAGHWPPPGADVAIAKFYARAGALELSTRWLERAYRDHVSTLPLDIADPVFDPLRPEPRFQGLLRQMGLTGAASD